MSEESLDHWIGRLNEGDPAAVERIFVEYEPYLRIIIRRRLSRGLRTKVESADIVQSVFADVVRGVQKGGWHFEGRPQFLAFLRRIALRRVADRYQRHGADLGREQSWDDVEDQNLPASDLPRPSQVAQGREFGEKILRACSPAHQEVVRLRMSGLRFKEIASKTGLHEGSVRRILYDLARKLSIDRGSQPNVEYGLEE